MSGRTEATAAKLDALSDGAPELRTVAEILADPGAGQLPEPVVPSLVWPGRSTLLSSREKAGKSTLATQAAAAVAVGAEFLDAPTTCGRVLWLAVEEHPDDVARRFLSHGGEGLDRIYLLDRVTAGADHLRALGVHASTVGAALIVIDTLAAYARDLAAEPGNASAWLPIVQGLTDVSRRTNAGLLLLHHARKSDGKYRDSTAIGAGVDVIVEMHEEQRVPTERRLEIKGRYSRETLMLGFENGRYAPVGGERSLAERIVAFVRARPDCSKNAISDAVRGDKAAIIKALDLLVEQGQLERRQDGSAQRHSLPVQPVCPSSYGVLADNPVDAPTQQELDPDRPRTEVKPVCERGLPEEEAIEI